MLGGGAPRHPISPRYRSPGRKTTTALPQRGGTSGTVSSIDGVAVSIGLVTAPRAARQRPIWSHGTAPLTPRHRAPRPASREYAPAHGSGEATTTPQCRPARVRPLKHLLLRPSNRRADLQPLRAPPPAGNQQRAANGTASVSASHGPPVPLDFVFLPLSRV